MLKEFSPHGSKAPSCETKRIPKISRFAGTYGRMYRVKLLLPFTGVLKTHAVCWDDTMKFGIWGCVGSLQRAVPLNTSVYDLAIYIHVLFMYVCMYLYIYMDVSYTIRMSGLRTITQLTAVIFTLVAYSLRNGAIHPSPCSIPRRYVGQLCVKQKPSQKITVGGVAHYVATRKPS